ncbi:uncharacterized protein J3D65DRAFT_629156, partial [Phyllosticta citribraziliensis]
MKVARLAFFLLLWIHPCSRRRQQQRHPLTISHPQLRRDALLLGWPPQMPFHTPVSILAICHHSSCCLSRAAVDDLPLIPDHHL